MRVPISALRWNPWPRVAVLRVKEEEVGALADRLVVAKVFALGGDLAGVHADPEAVLAAGLLGDAVVEVPDLEAAVVVPADPGAVDRVVPVVAGRQGGVGVVAERAAAVRAVADAVALEATPGVVGESVGLVALDDLPQDARQVLVVVGAVDAGDEEIARAVGCAVLVDGEPVGVFEVGLGCGAVGVHACDDGETFGAGVLNDLAEEVAVAEVLGAGVELQGGGVVGDDPAGVDDDPLDAGVAPVLAPPGAVVTGRIEFGEVGLTPAYGVAVPDAG